MAATTIKVSTETRDAINALADERGLTAGSVIEHLLEEYLWSVRMEEARRAMRNASDEDKRSYLEETREWDDAVSGDGLADW